MILFYCAILYSVTPNISHHNYRACLNKIHKNKSSTRTWYTLYYCWAIAEYDSFYCAVLYSVIPDCWILSFLQKYSPVGNKRWQQNYPTNSTLLLLLGMPLTKCSYCKAKNRVLIIILLLFYQRRPLFCIVILVSKYPARRTDTISILRMWY